MDAKGSLTTSLVINLELPALGSSAQLCFAVKPARQNHILESLEDVVQVITSEWEDDLEHVDTAGSDRTLATFRKKAMAAIDEWQGKLKMAEEWKVKVDRADKKMNKMREDYFKELFHLREQVYQQEKAKKDGTEFQPTYAVHFDPTEYTMEDEIQKVVEAKVKLIQQEADARVQEAESKSASRITTLNDQLATTKMILNRKEVLLERLRLDLEKTAAEANSKGNEDGERPPSKDVPLSPDSREPGDAEPALPEMVPMRSSSGRHRPPNGGKRTSAGGPRCASSLAAPGAGGSTQRVTPQGPKVRSSYNRDGDPFGNDSGGSSLEGEAESDEEQNLPPRGSGVGQGSTKLKQVAKKGVMANRFGRGSKKVAGAKVEGWTNSAEKGCDPITSDICALAFKTQLVSRGVQSFVDGRMLDKAEEFFDRVAEENWGLLVQLMDDDSDDEEPEAGDDTPGPAVGKTVTMGKTLTSRRFSVSDAMADDSEEGRARLRSNVAAVLEKLQADAENGVQVPPELADAVGHARLRASPLLEALEREGEDRPHFLRRQSVRRPVVPTKEEGIQCAMQRIVMLSPLERWFPADINAHDVQLQQLLDMAWEIEERLPQMRARAQKLASAAKGDREKQLVEQLDKLGLMQRPAQPTEAALLALGVGGAPTGAERPAPSSPAGGAVARAQAGIVFTPGAAMLNAGLGAGASLLSVLNRHGVCTAGSLEQDDPADAGGVRANRRTATGRPPPTTGPKAPANAGMGIRASSRSTGGQFRHSSTTTPGNDFGEGGLSSDDDDEPTLPFRGQLAQTAKPMVAPKNLRLIEQKARLRASGVGNQLKADRPAAEDTDATPDAQLTPGWSGLVAEPAFAARGVPIQREEPEKPPERSSSSAAMGRGSHRPGGKARSRTVGDAAEMGFRQHDDMVLHDRGSGVGAVPHDRGSGVGAEDAPMEPRCSVAGGLHRPGVGDGELDAQPGTQSKAATPARRPRRMQSKRPSQDHHSHGDNDDAELSPERRVASPDDLDGMSPEQMAMTARGAPSPCKGEARLPALRGSMLGASGSKVIGLPEEASTALRTHAAKTRPQPLDLRGKTAAARGVAVGPGPDGRATPAGPGGPAPARGTFGEQRAEPDRDSRVGADRGTFGDCEHGMSAVLSPRGLREDRDKPAGELRQTFSGATKERQRQLDGEGRGSAGDRATLAAGGAGAAAAGAGAGPSNSATPSPSSSFTPGNAAARAAGAGPSNSANPSPSSSFTPGNTAARAGGGGGGGAPPGASGFSAIVPEEGGHAIIARKQRSSVGLGAMEGGQEKAPAGAAVEAVRAAQQVKKPAPAGDAAASAANGGPGGGAGKGLALLGNSFSSDAPMTAMSSQAMSSQPSAPKGPPGQPSPRKVRKQTSSLPRP